MGGAGVWCTYIYSSRRINALVWVFGGCGMTKKITWGYRISVLGTRLVPAHKKARRSYSSGLKVDREGVKQ
jgi:hypothetical protein